MYNLYSVKQRSINLSCKWWKEFCRIFHFGLIFDWIFLNYFLIISPLCPNPTETLAEFEMYIMIRKNNNEITKLLDYKDSAYLGIKIQRELSEKRE